jgi:hypothetical protein
LELLASAITSSTHSEYSSSERWICASTNFILESRLSLN